MMNISLERNGRQGNSRSIDGNGLDWLKTGVSDNNRERGRQGTGGECGTMNKFPSLA